MAEEGPPGCTYIFKIARGEGEGGGGGGGAAAGMKSDVQVEILCRHPSTGFHQAGLHDFFGLFL